MNSVYLLRFFVLFFSIFPVYGTKAKKKLQYVIEKTKRSNQIHELRHKKKACPKRTNKLVNKQHGLWNFNFQSKNIITRDFYYDRSKLNVTRN